jgi:hypothetical protein
VDEVKPRVAIGYVHGDERASSFVDSLDALVAFDRTNAGLTVHDHGRISVRGGTDGLVAARNAIAATVVEAGVDWLLFVDSDMGFAPDTLYRLLAVADPAETPIVGALCFAQRQFAHDGMNGSRTSPMPTIYNWVDVDGQRTFRASSMYPVDAVVRCEGTGSACVLIHRSVFTRIGSKGWYDRIRGTDGSLLGEDVSFCVRANAAQIPIHVHTGVRTTHFKRQWLGETDHWRAYVPPPATEEVAVIVPVMLRPQNAEPFMRSLRASTGLANAYAICDADDEETIKAWHEVGAKPIIRLPRGGRAGSFAEKVNAGYRESFEPWLFICGDDVQFRPGWLDHGLHVAETFGASVVGTNDLGNPRVLAGEHATHLLIRRSYVDEQGASWDGPGVVAHEGYRHWYVDDEIVTSAKQRGVWQMALGSVVEHFHPLFGKAEQDDVYRLGQSFAQTDRATFLERSEKYLRGDS